MKDFLPKIQSPCSKRWDDLVGCDKKRFCSECQLHVHNLSAMSPGERSVFLNTPGHKCGAYLNTPEVRTVNLRLWRSLDRLRFCRPLFAGLAVLVALFQGGCATPCRKDPIGPPPTHKEVAPPESADGKEYEMVGGIGVERPLWQRILWPFGD